MATAAPCEHTCTLYDNFSKATVHGKIALVRLELTCLGQENLRSNIVIAKVGYRLLSAPTLTNPSSKQHASNYCV